VKRKGCECDDHGLKWQRADAAAGSGLGYGMECWASKHGECVKMMWREHALNERVSVMEASANANETEVH